MTDELTIICKSCGDGWLIEVDGHLICSHCSVIHCPECYSTSVHIGDDYVYCRDCRHTSEVVRGSKKRW